MKLSALIQHIGGEAFQLPAERADLDIVGINSLETATEQEVSFLTNPRYAKYLQETKAAAVIVAKRQPEVAVAQVIHPNPYAAMATVSQMFFERQHSFGGQSELAYIAEDANVHPSAVIYPFVYIDNGAVVEEGCILYPGVFIGRQAKVGKQTVMYPNAVLLEECDIGNNGLIHPGAVIGGDGFGFAPTGRELVKIPQLGRALIGDDVEIGSNSTVDRGAFEDTTIADGCKLDSQVHIAHGVKLGRYAMLCGQTEIAGSTKIGENLIMAGQSAIGPSLEVTDHVTLGPRAGLTNSEKRSGTYMGMPLSPIKEWRRQAVAMKQLPDVLSRLRKLEAALAKLQKNTDAEIPAEGC